MAAVDQAVVVPATSNIFAAGRRPDRLHSFDPGGGGAGTLPPGWRLPPHAGSGLVATFPEVTGRVAFWTGVDPMNGPGGDLSRTTDVESFRGISGLVYRENGSFLSGVFLTDTPPSNPAPPRLDFTKSQPTHLIRPRIGQVFFIGDGRDYRYQIPRGASRLFLGAVDGMLWQGPPGFYGNNSGSFEATVRLSGEDGK